MMWMCCFTHQCVKHTFVICPFLQKESFQIGQPAWLTRVFVEIFVDFFLRSRVLLACGCLFLHSQDVFFFPEARICIAHRSLMQENENQVFCKPSLVIYTLHLHFCCQLILLTLNFWRKRKCNQNTSVCEHCKVCFFAMSKSKLDTKRRLGITHSKSIQL